jgi:Bacterial archaeo-eukaryotic release factor family 3
MSTQAELSSVLADSQAPAISIFVPTHRAGQEIRQDPIRLKNLVKQAEEQLIKEGTRPVEARKLLEPLAGLVEDAAFWRHQTDGLALFRSPDVFRIYRLPFTVSEFVAVSDRFYIKPLLSLLMNDARFYVLALSQKSIRLLECSRDAVEPVDLPDVPQGMDEVLPEEPEPQLQRHSLPVGRQEHSFIHGHGVGTDDEDVINLRRYLLRVENGLRERLKTERAPLILACVEYLAPLYKAVSTYRFILDPIVEGSPDSVGDEELQQKAWPIADAHFQEARAKAAAEYHEGIAKARGSHNLDEVLTAAFQGRIATLFVPLGVCRWGRFDFNNLRLEQHDEEQAGDDELLDLAVAQTLQHDGTVYGVKPDEMPGSQLLAAVYRY